MQYRKRIGAMLTVAVMLGASAGSGWAAVPATLNYQGFLTNPTTGVPLNAPVGSPLSVTFKLYSVATGGTALYTETQSVVVSNGVFNVQIGTGSVPNGGATLSSLVFDVPYWLETTIGTQTLSPRQPLASSATALRAKVAEALPPVPGTGTGNTALGSSALAVNTSGFGNTAFGTNALSANKDGYFNTAEGYNALAANTSGGQNIAIGSWSLPANTTGVNNISIGVGALYGNTTGVANIAVGTNALAYNTTGTENTAIGPIVLGSNDTGSQNTAVGSGALYNSRIGNGNTATGEYALGGNISGNNNIALGYHAGINLDTGNYNIDIGNQGLAGEANTTRIGDGNQNRTFVSGIYGIYPANGSQYPVVVDSAGQLGSAVTLRVPGANNWDLNNTEGDFSIGTSTVRLKIGVPTGGGGVGDIAIKADGGINHLSLIAAGGTTIYSNTARTAGVSLGAGSGTWSTLSDRAAKRDIEPIDTRTILARVAAMPVYTWRYRSEVSGAQHIGPMAQDFYTAFSLGDSDKHIATVDADGVALAAIQGLNAKLEEKEAQLQAQAAQLKAQADRIAALEVNLRQQAKSAEVEQLRDKIAELQRTVELLVSSNSSRGKLALMH